MDNSGVSYDFYVYLHKKKADGVVFYVGKGTRNRAWRNDGRSLYWNRVSSKHGHTVEIYKDSLSEEEAFNEESALIKSIGIENLVNHTYGGEGISGYRFTVEQRKNLSQSHLGYKVTDETRRKISSANKGRVNSASVRGSISSRMIGNDFGRFRVITDELRRKLSEANKGYNNYNADLTKYNFIHNDGRVFFGTRFELKDKYGDCVRALFYTKPNKTVYGWRLHNDP